MSTALERGSVEVPPEEIDRRIAEFRQAMAERLAPAVVVYHPPHWPCPWDGCGLQILGIEFRLEEMIADETLRTTMLRDWWVGPGLVARCPRCQRHVAYEVLQKRAVPVIDPTMSLLPDEWPRVARISWRPADSG